MNINSFYLAQGSMSLNTNQSLSNITKTLTQDSSSSSEITIGHYNSAIGTIKSVEQDIKDFQEIADKTTDPEEKKRFTEAVQTSKDFLSKYQASFQNTINVLHLDKSLTSTGKGITPQAYDAYVANGYKVNADVLSGLVSVKIPRFQHKLLGNENDTGFSVVA